MVEYDRRPVRVLILDDEPVIAMDLESMVLDAGYDVAGTTGKIETALAMIDAGLCDGAILDANLSGVSAAAVAAALTSRGLPFLVLSGYSLDQLPEAMRDAPCLQKPTNAAQLINLMDRTLNVQRA
jgi:DNA-binding NtrC family response regulator